MGLSSYIYACTKSNYQVKEFVIPDHLRLLPTDSEEEKQRKRKKVRIYWLTYRWMWMVNWTAGLTLWSYACHTRLTRQVKHLKAQWKQRHAGALEAQEEAARGGGAGSWKDYLNKSKKKSVAAKGLGALKKGSIFASPDTVRGVACDVGWVV